MWEITNPSPVVYIGFSPDERYFVTRSKHDRLVKIWYRQYTKSQIEKQKSEKDKKKKKKAFGKATDHDDEEEEEVDDRITFEDDSKAKVEEKKEAETKVQEVVKHEFEEFSFIYLPHPCAVRSVEWRLREILHKYVVL